MQIRPQAGVVVPPEVRMPDAPPVYAVLEVARPPKIDGKLDEEAWQVARPMGQFYLDSGDGPMRLDTFVRMVRDDTYIYLAVDCRHPKIGEVPVRKGSRDRVNWAGETIEVWFDTDRAAADYVQIIFDMSGAFTDTFGGLPKWDGDITAATDVGGEGWRLEARIRMAGLAGGGKADAFLWGANIARNSGDDSASWARLLGSYQQPDHFGLLTFAEGNLAVDDVGLGIFAIPSDGVRSMPARLTLRNVSSEPAEYLVTLTSAPATSGPATERKITVPASATQEVIASLAAAGQAVNVTVSTARADAKELFRTTLPIRPGKPQADCLASSQVTCVVRPASSVALSKDQAVVYLMAQSLADAPLQHTGELRLIAQEDNRTVWQAPVTLDLPAKTFAAQKVNLPVEKMEEGQYRLEWSLSAEPRPVVLRSELVYTPLGLEGLQQLLSSGKLEDILAKVRCPLPKDTADRALLQARIDRLTDAVQRQAERKELDLSSKILHAYRQSMDIVAEVRTGQPYTARQRGWFEAAFYSPADGSAQPFSLFVPLDYDKDLQRKYPLVVYLHGRGGTHGGEAGFVPGKDSDVTDRLMLSVLGRGRAAGYGPVVADEVMREIREVIGRYRIDQDAVHLWGQSMGGFGTFEIAAAYPDLFATARPHCGGGFAPLAQMSNLPTYVHHGLADTTVSPFWSVVAVEQMRRNGCPVQLYLYPDVGHDVNPAAEKVTRWETYKAVKRDPQPASVVLSANMPALRKAYWLTILRSGDIHKQAYLRATFAGPNHLVLAAENVSWLQVALPCKWVDPGKPLQISDAAGHRWTELTVGDAAAIFIGLDGQKIEATTKAPINFADATVYTGGGARNMFLLGRPVCLVYGTAGSTDQAESLASLAQDLRRWNPLSWGPLETGGWPILKDSEVDEQTLKTCDLLILGTPKDNSLLAKMASQLPVKFDGDRIQVEAEPAMSWPEGKVAFSLYYRNPLSPERRIWWFAGIHDRQKLSGSADITRNNIFGPAGPEFIVQAADSMGVLATASLTADWKLVRPAPLEPVQQKWATPEELDRRICQALCDSLPVDVSLASGYGRTDLFAWDQLTVGEAIATIPEQDLWIVRLRGDQLSQWWKAVAQASTPDGQPLRLPWAGVAPEALQAETLYDVLLAPDMPAAFMLEKEGISLLDGRLVPASEMRAIKERVLRKALAASTGAPATQPKAAAARQ